MAQHEIEKGIDELCCGFKIHPHKDEDSFVRAQYLKILSRISPTMLIMGVVLWLSGIIGIIGFALLVLSSIPISGLILFIITQIGNKYISLIYGGGRANWSLRERLHGELLRVKYMRRNNHFAEALEIVNTILEQKPDYKEALFIKAQILWENLSNYGGAKMCLKTIIDSQSLEDEHINQWATTLSEKIKVQSKKYPD